MTFQPTDTMIELDRAFQEIFGYHVLPKIDPPIPLSAPEDCTKCPTDEGTET